MLVTIFAESHPSLAKTHEYPQMYTKFPGINLFDGYLAGQEHNSTNLYLAENCCTCIAMNWDEILSPARRRGLDVRISFAFTHKLVVSPPH